MTPDAMTDSTIHQAAVAIAAAHVIEWAKGVPGFGWLQNPIIAKGVGLLAVLAGSLGVHWQMSGSLDAGGTITLAWPMLSTMVDAGEHIIIQWALQEGYYQKFVKTQTALLVTTKKPAEAATPKG